MEYVQTEPKNYIHLQLTRTYLSQNQPVKTRSSQVKFKFESTDLTFVVFLIFIFAEFDFDSERT